MRFVEARDDHLEDGGRGAHQRRPASGLRITLSCSGQRGQQLAELKHALGDQGIELIGTVGGMLRSP
jgi:hypothetical protein